eukprot:TRINITY_DN13365_c0_g1_i1.p1 TRINITY_DN13365_c0_g1~~TRINITY_DN13365_c0_g1_i1.p1  ORF type:complete len:268 (-),score=74.05 TRINITY_DN13365_c0_g1_i1:95-898(-)
MGFDGKFLGLCEFFFFFSSRRRHTRCREVSWARRCVQETGTWERKIEAMSQATDKKQIQIEKLRCIVKQQNNLKLEQVSDNRIYLKSILENRRSTTEQELLRVQSRSARLYEQKLHAEKMRKLFEKELLISKHLQDKKLEKLNKKLLPLQNNSNTTESSKQLSIPFNHSITPSIFCKNKYVTNLSCVLKPDLSPHSKNSHDQSFLFRTPHRSCTYTDPKLQGFDSSKKKKKKKKKKNKKPCFQYNQLRKQQTSTKNKKQSKICVSNQ